MSDRIYIFDTTLRDGEQSPGCTMNINEKLRLAKLMELGVDVIEAGFPIASEGDFEAVNASQRVSVRTGRGHGPVLRAGYRARREARSAARRPRIHAFIASDIHLKYKLKKTRQQVLDEAVEAVQLARRRINNVEFSPNGCNNKHWDT